MIKSLIGLYVGLTAKKQSKKEVPEVSAEEMLKNCQNNEYVTENAQCSYMPESENPQLLDSVLHDAVVSLFDHVRFYKIGENNESVRIYDGFKFELVEYDSYRPPSKSSLIHVQVSSLEGRVNVQKIEPAKISEQNKNNVVKIGTSGHIHRANKPAEYYRDMWTNIFLRVSAEQINNYFFDLDIDKQRITFGKNEFPVIGGPF